MPEFHRLRGRLKAASSGCLCALLLVASLSAIRSADARPRHRPILYGCCGYAPNADPFDTDVPPPVPRDEPRGFGVPPVFRPDLEPQVVPEASPRPGPAPYPQGFAIDVPVVPGRDRRADAAPHGRLTRYREVADALAACWAPPAQFDDHPWNQVTLRVSFKRDGTVNGLPRVPYVDEGLTGTARSGLTQSLMGALKRCTPLPLSATLGAAIAGQIFALRFIEQDQD